MKQTWADAAGIFGGASGTILLVLIVAALCAASAAVTVVALGPRLGARAVSGDGVYFALTASRLCRGEGFSTPKIYPYELNFVKDIRYFPDLSTPPLFSMALGVIFRILGTGSVSIWVCNTLLLMGTSVAVFLMAREAFGRGAAMLAAIMCATNPAMLAAVIEGSNSVLLAFLFICILYVVFRYRMDAHWANALAGGLAALCYLTQYSFWSLIVPLAVFSAVLNRGDLKKALPALLCGFFLVAAPWWARNISVAGNPFFCLRPYKEAYLRAISPGRLPGGWLFLSHRFRTMNANLPRLLTMYGNIVVLLFVPAIFWKAGDARFRAARNLAYLTAAAVVVFVASGLQDWDYAFLPFLPFILLAVAGYVFHLCAACAMNSVRSICAVAGTLILLNASSMSRSGVSVINMPAPIAGILSKLPQDRVVVTDDGFSMSWFYGRRSIELPDTVEAFVRISRTFGGKVALYFSPDFAGETEGNPQFRNWGQVMSACVQGYLPPEPGMRHGVDLNGQGFLLY